MPMAARISLGQVRNRLPGITFAARDLQAVPVVEEALVVLTCLGRRVSHILRWGRVPIVPLSTATTPGDPSPGRGEGYWEGLVTHAA